MDATVHIDPNSLSFPRNLSVYAEVFPISLCNISHGLYNEHESYNISLLENYYISLLFIPICYVISFPFEDNFSYFFEAEGPLI